MEARKPLTKPDGRTPLTSPSNDGQKSKTDTFSTLSKWLVLCLAAIPRFFASIMEHFTEAGSVGAVALGSLVFVAGVLLTSDSYWVRFVD